MLACLLLAAFAVLAAPASAWAWDSPAVGLRLPDPAGWERRADSEEGALVRYYAPPAPGPRGSIGVSVEEMGEVETLQASMLQAAVRRLAADLEGFSLLGTRKVHVAGLPGYRLGYTAKVHGHAFRASQVMVVRGGRLYLFTLTTSKDGHKAALPVFDGMLKGLEFRDPE